MEQIAFAQVLEIRIPEPHQLVARRGVIAACQVSAKDCNEIDGVSQLGRWLQFFFAA